MRQGHVGSMPFIDSIIFWIQLVHTVFMKMSILNVASSHFMVTKEELCMHTSYRHTLKKKKKIH